MADWKGPVLAGALGTGLVAAPMAAERVCGGEAPARGCSVALLAGTEKAIGAEVDLSCKGQCVGVRIAELEGGEALSKPPREKARLPSFMQALLGSNQENYELRLWALHETLLGLERWPEGEAERRDLVERFASIGVKVDARPALGRLTMGASMTSSKCREWELDPRHCRRGATSRVFDATVPPDDRIIFEMDGLSAFPELYDTQTRPGNKEQFLGSVVGVMGGYQVFTDPEKQNPAPFEGPQGFFLRDLPWWLDATEDLLRYAKERDFEPGSRRAIAFAKHLDGTKPKAMTDLALRWTEGLLDLVRRPGDKPYEWHGTVDGQTVMVRQYNGGPEVGLLVVSDPNEPVSIDQTPFLRRFYFPTNKGLEKVLQEEADLLRHISSRFKTANAALRIERRRLLGE